ncbi:MAG: folate family ECF transporter S component [Clostridiales bacterium]|nr:folate family ECF transporter S component [Clostridiales bacterium]
MNPIASLVASSKELKRTRSLVQAAMLLAMQVVLSAYASVYIDPSNKVSIGFIASAATGALFGPFVAMVNGGLADLLQYALQSPGVYNPGFTLNYMLTGMVFGLAFYRREIRPVHVIAARAIVVVIVNLGLGTLWITLQRGTGLPGFLAMLPARATKALIQLPFDMLLMLPLIDRIKKLG